MTSTWTPVIPEGPMYKFQRDYLHHSAAVRVGDLLICSGVIGMVDKKVPVDPAEQFDQAFQNLRDLLIGCGRSLADVAELFTFHVDSAKHMETFVSVKDRYFTAAPYPAWTAIGCSDISFGALVEIRAQASFREVS